MAAFLKILMEPAIIIITMCFLAFLFSVIRNYSKVEKNLKEVYEFLQTLSKKEISYRFNQLDEFMTNNYYTSTSWEDFKKALIFPEKLYTAAQNAKNNVNNSSDIFLTVDSSFFFNEESLIYTKINHKFIQSMSTILTGLGPFFTFLKMAIAFAKIDFSPGAAEASLNALIANIQVAALCSVFAVGYSLIFLFMEKILYARKCKKYNLLIQKEFIRLFDVCTSEQFLLDLLKEAKIQNTNNENILKALPAEFSSGVAKAIGETTIPYLENILYSLNKLNESYRKSNGGSDMVDKLF